MNEQANNKRIAKNTVFMYMRMAITMCLGLYTSRAVLNNLGIEDYGLYNVIGGIVALFTVLNSSMVNTTSRFITVQLAKDDEIQTRNIFNLSVLVHCAIAVSIVVLGETVGIWYIQNKLVVPEGRMYAVHWIYQLSLLSCLFSVLNVPYNAAIVAHEKLGAFAIMQISNSLLKLIIALLLAVSPFDKLIFYASLLTIVSLLDFLIYRVYSLRKFCETSFSFYWNNSVFKEMMLFTGWTLIGNFVNFFYTQGINLLLNAFCGPATNAARGIAVQVEGIVRQFANNIQVAINPQILKSYSTNEMDRMYYLIMASSRYCFYLLFFLSLPLMLEADFVLNLWLGLVPEHTVNFIRILLVILLFDTFVNPMFTANLASGKLKLYHFPLSILMFAFMFVTYFAIKLSGIAESVYYSLLVVTVVGYIMKIYILERQVGLKKLVYVKNVLIPVILVVTVSIIFPIILHCNIEEGWGRFFIVGITSVIAIACAVFFIGVNEAERKYVQTIVLSKIIKHRNV